MKQLYTQFIALTAVGALSLSTAVSAHDGHAHDEHAHEQEAHVHGIVNLTAVLEKNILMLELNSPAMNLTGFEHKAESDADHKAIKSAEKSLKNIAGWLKIDGGNCELIKAEVSNSFGKKHAEHDHEEHKHDHEKHEHEHEHMEEAGHNAFYAEYQYVCKSANVNGMDISLAKQFNGIEEIELKWIVNGKQGLNELKKGQTHVKF